MVLYVQLVLLSVQVVSATLSVPHVQLVSLCLHLFHKVLVYPALAHAKLAQELLLTALLALMDLLKRIGCVKIT
jgi:hypothetical protein